MAADGYLKTLDTPRPAGVVLLCSDCRKRNTSCADPLKLAAGHSRLATSLAAKHGWPEQPCRSTWSEGASSAAVAEGKAAKGGGRVGMHAILQLHSAAPRIVAHCVAAGDPLLCEVWRAGVQLQSRLFLWHPGRFVAVSRSRPRETRLTGLHGPMPRLPIPLPP